MRKLNKLLCLMLVLALTVSMFVLPVGAYAFVETDENCTQYWSLSDPIDNGDGTYSINVKLQTNYPTGVLQFVVLSSDTTIAKLKDVTLGSALPEAYSPDLSYNKTTGKVMILAGVLESTPAVPIDGVVAVVTYTYRGSGVATISIENNPRTASGGTLFAGRMSDGDLYTGDLVYGQKVTVGGSIDIPSVHNFGEWNENVTATCTDNGEKYRICAGCDEIETEEIEAFGHSYPDEWNTRKSATCTEDGEKYRVCSVCEEEKTTVIEARGHNYSTEWTVDIEPTCTEYGSKSYHCSICGDKADITAISPTGEHTWGEWRVRTAATCTEDGEKYRVCSVCEDEETTVIEARGHNYSTEWTVDIEPTCTEYGSKSHHCSACGDKADITAISPTGEHTWGEWQVRTAATCAEDGEKYRVCSICEEEETVVIKKTEEHDFTGDFIEPTCTVDGYMSHWCIICGFDDSAGILPAYGHDYGDWVTDCEPTCIEDGEKHRVCSYCNETEIAKISATGEHDYISVEWQDPSCVDGWVDRVCLVCGESSRMTSPATGEHSYGEWQIRTEATCTEGGEKYRVCSVCEEEETSEIEAQGHNYSTEWTVDVEPTCTEYGSKSHHCSACGDKADITAISPTGEHTWGEWQVRTAATCAEDGEKYRVCSVCEDEETSEIEALGHDYSAEWTVDVEPTCTEYGSKSHHCSICGDKTDATVIAAIGHSYSVWVTDYEPTCTVVGSKHKICKYCGNVVTEVISANGHNYSTEWTVDVEPTCTEDGSKSHHCSVCGAKSDITTVEKTEHSYALTSAELEHPHECTYRCSACGNEQTGNKTSDNCLACNFSFTAVDVSSYKVTSYTGSVTDIIIPSVYDNCAVMEIGSGCFRNNTAITSVEIPFGVTTIGTLAFMNCNSLEKVVIPSTVTSIGAKAFYNFSGTIYCVRDSVAHQYAVDNGIDYVILDIGATENTRIDYDNLLIFTFVYACTNIADMMFIPSETLALPIPSMYQGPTELYGTGTEICVFGGDEYVGDYKIIVVGDLNGDSVCDALDAAQAERIANGNEIAENEQIYAANGCISEEFDVSSYQNVVNMALTS